MFNPTRDEARQFFIDAWRKYREQAILTPMESLCAHVIAEHPEYHATLDAGMDAIAREWSPDMGESNPFLHLSLHIAIEEQLSINQPPGLREAFAAQCERLQNRHDALHVVLDCLGQTLWQAQREGTPLDAPSYVACVRGKLA